MFYLKKNLFLNKNCILGVKICLYISPSKLGIKENIMKIYVLCSADCFPGRVIRFTSGKSGVWLRCTYVLLDSQHAALCLSVTKTLFAKTSGIS